MMINSRRAVLAAALLTTCHAAGVLAQIAPSEPSSASSASPAPNDESGAIIVTGTRLTGLKASDSPAPVQVLGSDALTKVGQPDLIQGLAQNLPSIQAQAFGGDLANLHLSFKLRGLSPNHTLVLLNGKRRHGTANVVVSGGAFGGNAAADIGLIPTSSIERIEVLQDGAAAQYGTDAIAGVINIIQKHKGSGGNLVVTGGHYIDEGGLTWDVMGNLGVTPFENAWLNVTAERKYHGYSFRGDIDARVVNTGQPNNVRANVLGLFPQLASAPNYPYTNRIAGDARYRQTSATFNAGWDILPDVQIYSFGSYAHKVGRSYENFRLPNVVVGVNTRTVGGVTTGDIPFPQGFSPQEVIRETDYAVTGGVKGTYAETNIDLSATYGHDINHIYTEKSANQTLYRTTSTATQNGFTPRNFHNGDFIADQLTVNLDATHEFNIGLAEPVSVAGGIEYRRETYAIRDGDPASYFGTGAQSFFGYAPRDAGNHRRTDWSEYLDVNVKPFEGLLVDGAVRHEDYSDFGTTTVWKLTGRYDFSPAFAVRGTASTGFRAPTLAEGFYSGINVGPTSISGIFAPNSPGAAFLGVSALGPEKSTNFSAGIVAKPVSALTVTVDAYSIRIRNRIVQSGALRGYDYRNPTSNPALSPTVSPSVLQALAANGVAIDPFIFTSGSGTVSINTFVNGLKTLTRGIDFVATYPSDFGSLGHVDWSLTANYNHTKIKRIGLPPSNIDQRVQLLDVPAQADLTHTTPKFRATAGAAWRLGMFDVTLRESIYGHSYTYIFDPINGAQLDQIKINTKWITDIDVGIRLFKALRLSAGANNVFNVYPTKQPAYYRQGLYINNSSGYASSIYPGFSPIGINGGYYYGKIQFDF